VIGRSKESLMRIVYLILGVVLVAGTASAQPKITPSDTKVGQGGTLTLTGLPCASGTPTVTFNGAPVPVAATTNPNAWSVTAAPLPPATQALPATIYSVKMNCGTTQSDPISIQVIAASAPAPVVPPAVMVPPPPEPQVTCAMNLTPKDGEPQATENTKHDCAAFRGPWKVRIGDRIQLQASGFRAWRDVNKNAVLHLYIGGVELTNVVLHDMGAVDSMDMLWTELDFDTADTQNRKAWVQVLQQARDSMKLPISMGIAGTHPFPSAASDGGEVVVELNLWPTGYLVFAGMVLVGLAIALVLLGKRSNLLRDGIEVSNEDQKAGKRPPYSLAKHQMALWFVVVVGTFLFVTLVTSVAAATSQTALLLIGISGATGLAALTIDNNKRAGADATRQSLDAERAALVASLEDPATGLKTKLGQAAQGSPEAIQLAAAIQVKNERLNEVTMELAHSDPGPRLSQGWYLDLLSDENGVSFHRLQMAVWTVVLVGTFIRAVWREFAMPEFDSTTLGLLGISSGTYLGFKFPERQ
jgi:hypothetical protein